VNWEKMNTRRISVERLECDKPLKRPRSRWEDNYKTDPSQIGWDEMDWIHLAQEGDY
jgi:hypothetical protein